VRWRVKRGCPANVDGDVAASVLAAPTSSAAHGGLERWLWEELGEVWLALVLS